MKELIQVKQAVLSALQAAGIPTLDAWPESIAKRDGSPSVTVAVGSAQGKALGFCNYLGQTYDETTQSVRELYGKLLEGEIALSVRGGTAAICEDCCQQTAEILLSALPSGVRPGQLRWEPPQWDPTTRLFLRQGTLSCTALFTAERIDEPGVFLDFILKGDLHH